MRVTTIGLFGFLLSPLGSLAQDISIASPTKDSNITPGQKLTIVLQAQGTTSSVKHIAFSTGFRTTSKHDDKSLGRPTVGSVSPQSPDVVFDGSKGTFTYEITVPSAKDFLDGFSAPYELTVSDLYLLGATFTPTLKLTSVQVNVQNNNSTGGDSPPDSNNGNNSTSATTPNSTDPNSGKGSNSSPTPSSDPTAGSNSNKPSSGAGSVLPSALYSLCFLLAAYLLSL